MPQLANNKRGTFDYEILDKMEVGIVLSGQEVKSVKLGQINLRGSYVTVRGNEAFLLNAHIPQYAKASRLGAYDPYRTRKLLMHKKEISSLIGKIKEKGLTMIPLSVYTIHNRIKLEIALGRSKKAPDKRESIKKRELDRRIRREVGAEL